MSRLANFPITIDYHVRFHPIHTHLEILLQLTVKPQIIFNWHKMRFLDDFEKHKDNYRAI